MNDLADLLDLSVVWEYRSLLLSGLLVNVYVFLVSAVLALALGLLLTAGQLKGAPLVRRAAAALCEILRSIPEYTLLIWLYIALPFLAGKVLGFRVTFDPTTTATATLGIVFAGYFAETFRAGFQSTHPGQREAAEALGILPRAVTRRILLPQILLRLSPEILNICVSLFKTTSIVSLIGLQDIMYQASLMSSQLMRPVPIYTGAALLFVSVVIAASLVVRAVTQRLRLRLA